MMALQATRYSKTLYVYIYIQKPEQQDKDPEGAVPALKKATHIGSWLTQVGLPLSPCDLRSNA